jgi:T-complex protein 1 subunit eta
MNRLRQKHCDVRAEDPTAGRWFGVDVDNEGVCDTFDKGVWEPVNSKIQAVSAACEAACLVLSVDETVRNPQSEQAQMQGRGQMGGKGGKGAPMSQAMGGQGMRGMGMAGGGGNGMKMMRGKGGK